MNTIREIEKINDEELERGLAGTSASWHSKYLKSAWVYVGALDHALTEGDVLCVLSQYGEVEDIHLAREEDTGKSRGFAFVKYEDSRSCVLAVDNFVGVKVLGRPLRVDHVEKYRLPKKLLEQEEAREVQYFGAGHAYKDAELSNQYNIESGQDLFAPVLQGEDGSDSNEKTKGSSKDDKRKRKKERNQKRHEKEGRRERKEERRSDRRGGSRHKKKRDRRQSDERGEGDIELSREGDTREKGESHRDKKKHKRSTGRSSTASSID